MNNAATAQAMLKCYRPTGHLSPLWRVVVILFLLWWMPCGLFAQFTVVYDHSETETVAVRYAVDSNSSDIVTNYFIREIARSIPRRFDYTSYSYSYRQVVRVIRLDDGSCEASVDINEARCTGDVLYKGFDISDVLFPNYIRFEGTLYDKYKKEVAVFRYSGSDLHWGYNKIGFATFRDTIRSPLFTFQLKEKVIQFDSIALDHFAEKLMLIDRYYQSKAVIAAGNRKLDAYNFDNIDMIIVYDIMLKDIERQVEDLYQLDLPGKLNLSSYDPIGYIDLFTAFSERTRRIRQQEENSLATLDQIYFNQGRKLLAAGEKSRALLYFKRSCNYNPLYVPSWYERARMLYANDSVMQAADIIQSVLTGMNPDPVMSDSVQAFAEKILKTLQQQGHDNLVLQKYNESVALIERGIRFCEGSPGLHCGEQIYKDYAASKYGLYQSYLSVAEKALQGGRYDLARVYVKEARDYQKKNQREIIGNVGADAVMVKLIQQLIKKGDTLCGRKKFDQALECYRKAAVECDSLEAGLCPAGLENGFKKAYNGLFSGKVQDAYRLLNNGAVDRAEQTLEEAKAFQSEHASYILYLIDYDTVYRAIRQFKYDRHVQTGVLSLKYVNYEDAFQSFEQAYLLSEQIRLREHKGLDSLLRLSGRPVLQTRIQRALALIPAQGAGPARVALDETDLRIQRCGLSDDSLLMAQLSSARVSIHNAYCGEISATCSDLLERGNHAADQKDYLAARALYDSALIMAKVAHDCHQDTTVLADALQRVGPAATYQGMLKRLQPYLLIGDTNAYFTGFLRACSFYREQQLAASGLPALDLVDQMAEASSSILKRRAVEFLLREGRTGEALRLMGLTLEGTKPDAQAVALLEKLAVRCADDDFRSNPQGDPVVKVGTYTDAKTGFPVFRRVYLKRFKNLVRSVVPAS